VPGAPGTAKVGRPAAATHEQVLDAAMAGYLRGQRIDVQAIAAGLGLGRSTVYRWFGSREQLIGEVLNRAADVLLDAAAEGRRGHGGPGLLATFDAFNRSLAEAPALRAFVEAEREAAIRIITSGAGVTHPHIVRRIVGLIEAEVANETYAPPVDPETLGYAIVRLAEAFLLNDVVGGIRGDVDRLRTLEAALLGVDRAGN
jgi:AcrR family transcriptional regulator